MTASFAALVGPLRTPWLAAIQQASRMAAAAAAAVDPLVGAGAVGWSVVAATIARFGICKRGGDDGSGGWGP